MKKARRIDMDTKKLRQKILVRPIMGKGIRYKHNNALVNYGNAYQTNKRQ